MCEARIVVSDCERFAYLYYSNTDYYHLVGSKQDALKMAKGAWIMGWLTAADLDRVREMIKIIALPSEDSEVPEAIKEALRVYNATLEPDDFQFISEDEIRKGIRYFELRVAPSEN